MTIHPSPNSDPAPACRCRNGPPYRETVPGEAFYLRRILHGSLPDAYLEWLADPDVIKYLQVRFGGRGPDDAQAFINSFDHVDRFLFGIHAVENDRYIGNITLRADPNHLFAHMGYLIGEKDYWRSNAAIEATSLVCDFAFFDRGLRKILEATTENHIASNFNFRRLGFTFEGKIPDLYWSDGKYQAATYWSMNATTWAEKRGRTAEEVTP